MGYYITKLKEKKLNEYIGSQTMYSCADNGAFDCEVDEELESYANNEDGVMAVVDKNGVDHFLKILKSGKCSGRDVEMLIKVVEKKYVDGFMICG